MLLIVPAYAALIGLVFVALSVRTIRLRRRLQIANGHGESAILMKAVRAHSNFAEYVPVALLLIVCLELQAGPTAWVHVLCIALLLGRTIHAYGLSHVDEDYRLRVAGMLLTFAVILSASVRLLLTYV